jgi:hypothetical protein
MLSRTTRIAPDGADTDHISVPPGNDDVPSIAGPQGWEATQSTRLCAIVATRPRARAAARCRAAAAEVPATARSARSRSTSATSSSMSENPTVRRRERRWAQRLARRSVRMDRTVGATPRTRGPKQRTPDHSIAHPYRRNLSPIRQAGRRGSRRPARHTVVPVKQLTCRPARRRAFPQRSGWSCHTRCRTSDP